MIICHSRRFIFVHVHKTAGEAITRALVPHLGWEDLVLGSTPTGNLRNLYYRRRYGLTKHSSARRIRQHVADETWERYLSFAFVRHPVDRIRSLYLYLERMASRRNRAGPHALAFRLPGLRAGDPLHWPGMQAYLETRSFSDFIRHPRLYADPGASPQINMVSEDGRIIVDRIGRFETLAEDFREIAAAVGLPGTRLVRVNVSSTEAARDPGIAPDDLACLRTRYKADFAAFGYD